MSFQSFIYEFFERYGRHDLPWRRNYDPYRIMVSEIMLQQTQVDRVIPKYLAFLELFPDAASLANTSVANVIKAWQGLGYNRRGLNLQRAAQHIVTTHHGKLPHDTESLLSLPGIGPYTAAAIQAFAFNLPSVVIETNIRTVYIHHFFPEKYQISDNELLPMIQDTLDIKNPRQWYSALMDYGTHLKSVLPNPTRRSKMFVKQSPFATSNRRLRGIILREVTLQPQSLETLVQKMALSPAKVQEVADALINEGFITQIDDLFHLTS